MGIDEVHGLSLQLVGGVEVGEDEGLTGRLRREGGAQRRLAHRFQPLRLVAENKTIFQTILLLHHNQRLKKMRNFSLSVKHAGIRDVLAGQSFITYEEKIDFIENV